MSGGSRIAVDGKPLVRNLTGAGKALAFLLRHLRNAYPEDEYLPLMPTRGTSWRLPRQFLWEQVQLPALAAGSRAALLHVPGGTAAPLLRRQKCVMTIHDIAPTVHPDYLPRGRSRWYWGKWVPFTARFADAILVPSESTRRQLVCRCGISEQRIHVTPWGVPLDAKAVHPPMPRHPDTANPYLLYVGTIDRRKDYGTLLRALRLLDQRVQLIVAGTVIEGRTDFRQLIPALGLQDRVQVVGYVREDELSALYRGAAVFIYPSFYEGFGLPVLEAMACGAPVITYNVTSLPEVAGDAAILLDPPVAAELLAEQVQRVLSNVSFRQDLIQRGVERARQFSWTTTAQLTHDVYERLLG